jgi:hypothetical protein
MRALRLLVIVLGVLLVGGTLALVVAIIMRSPHRSESPPADSQRADSAKLAAPYDTVVDLPAAAAVQSIQPAGDRLFLHLVLPSGRQQIIVLDASSGVRRGTIELRPGQ